MSAPDDNHEGIWPYDKFAEYERQLAALRAHDAEAMRLLAELSEWYADITSNPALNNEHNRAVLHKAHAFLSRTTTLGVDVPGATTESPTSEQAG